MSILPEARLYIDGKLRRAAGDKTYDNIGPWTAEPVGKAADASAQDVDEAIAAARHAGVPVGVAAKSVRGRSGAAQAAPAAARKLRRDVRGPAIS